MEGFFLFLFGGVVENISLFHEKFHVKLVECDISLTIFAA